MAETNKHGLSRTIREAVKREVRQRSGFGCVCCGCLIYEYHHFSPPFAEATVHSADGITLLCGGCHTRATNRLLSDASVRRANAEPFCLKNPAHKPIDVDADYKVLFGNALLLGSGPIVSANDRVLLSVERGEGGVSVSADIVGREGESIV